MTEISPDALPQNPAQRGDHAGLNDDRRPEAGSIPDIAGIAGHCPACGERALLVSTICAQCEEPLVVAKATDGQSILRLKRDAQREKMQHLEDQLSIYWMMLGSFQAIAIISLGPLATRHLSKTAFAFVQQNWMELYIASFMVSLLTTGLILFLSGALVKFGYRQMAWIGVLTNLIAFLVTLVSPLIPVALIFGIVLVPGCRLMWLWYKSSRWNTISHQETTAKAGRFS